MRNLLRLTALTGAAALCGIAIGFAVPAMAQKSSSPACGPEAYSGASQTYASVPCAPETQKAADGKATCGPEAYSGASQTYVSLPCTAPVKKTSDGKAACGPEAYSGAAQTYASLPCPAK